MKFRKKPVVIEAVQFKYNDESIAQLRVFAGDAIGKIKTYRHLNAIPEAEIKTLEDGVYMKVVHIATEGDWIIKGVDGEFYACKPDIFEKTYEKVDQ